MFAQSAESPKYEFRSAWVATAVGLDFPRGSTAVQQEAALRNIIRNMKAHGMNAVVFQASPRGDAYYRSERLPWARRLSGTMGQDPGWDPLQVAIEEAHANGMELHAWYNFGKIGDIGTADLQDSDDPRHVYFGRPDLVATVGNEVWLNPGIPEAREWAIANVMEIVNNYDVDAVHFDFIRYGTSSYSGDIALRNEHDPGMDMAPWRRHNITRFATGAHDAIKAVKPWVKVGSTPLGHYKESGGWPANLAYAQVFQDSRLWLQLGQHDYLAPQIYWGIGNQDDAPRFEWLVNDWMGETYDRHIYVGTAPYKSFVMAELPAQIDTTRAHGAHGQIHFRYQTVALGFPYENRYARPALVPPMEWLNMTPPAAPQGFGYEWDDEVVTLRWAPPEASDADAETRYYAVYRIQSAQEPDFTAALADPGNLLAVTGDTLILDSPADVSESYYYVVTSVSRNWVESVRTDAIVIEGRATDTETTRLHLFSLEQNFPNPFANSTTVGFSLQNAGSVTLRVYNVLGQVVATLADNESFAAGPHTMSWTPVRGDGTSLASGTYFYSLEVDGVRETKRMTVLTR